jgi:hypothetical protein
MKELPRPIKGGVKKPKVRKPGAPIDGKIVKRPKNIPTTK